MKLNMHASIDNELSPSSIIIKSSAQKFIGKKLLSLSNFEIQINEEGNMSLSVVEKNSTMLFICEK